MQSHTSKSKQQPKRAPKHETKHVAKKNTKAAVSASKPAPKVAHAAASKPAHPIASKPAQPIASKISPKTFDPVPLPEHGGHSHSYAAHLGGPMPAHTAPAFTFRQVPLREPPQQVSRIGKQHR